MKKLSLVLICLFLAVPCWGRTIYVDVDSPNDPGTGSYEDPFRRIQVAIDDPCTIDSDTIIVAEGIYTGDGNRDIDFLGKAITVRSTNPDDPAVVAATIIDCENSGRGFNFHSGEGLDSILSGLTITNGNSDENNGAGIYCIDSSPTIENCIITGNSTGSTYGSGGGIFSTNSSLKINKCTIRDNSGAAGGGITCSTGRAIISDCTITGNSASSSDLYMISSGGGIFAYNDFTAVLVIKNCTISGNSAQGWGGGIACFSNGTISNCIITGNSSSMGGGIACRNSNPTISNCTISNNEDNGIYCDMDESPTVTNCILWNNTIGEIFDGRGGTPVVTYCDIEGGYTGLGNIDADPCFADTSSAEPDEWDLHLQSQAGRWDPNSESWVTDANTSPAIDAGDPADPIGYEPFTNGGIINMGAYGGTAQASKSYFGTTPCQTIVAGDVNGDCKVDFKDFALMAFHWLESR